MYFSEKVHMMYNGAVFENTYFTFFSHFEKHDFLRFFFKMTYHKVVKSR